MTTHGFYRASHHVEHVTSQEGERGPAGLSAGERGRVPSTHACTRGKGSPRADALPWMDSSAHPNGLKPAAMSFQESCWLWGAWGHQPPCDAAVSITLWLFCFHGWKGRADSTEQCPDTEGSLGRDMCPTTQLGSERPWSRAETVCAGDSQALEEATAWRFHAGHVALRCNLRIFSCHDPV